MPEYAFCLRPYVVTMVACMESLLFVSCRKSAALWRSDSSTALVTAKSFLAYFISQRFVTWSLLAMTRSIWLPYMPLSASDLHDHEQTSVSTPLMPSARFICDRKHPADAKRPLYLRHMFQANALERQATPGVMKSRIGHVLPKELVFVPIREELVVKQGEVIHELIERVALFFSRTHDTFARTRSSRARQASG